MAIGVAQQATMPEFPLERWLDDAIDQISPLFRCGDGYAIGMQAGGQSGRTWISKIQAGLPLLHVLASRTYDARELEAALAPHLTARL